MEIFTFGKQLILFLFLCTFPVWLPAVRAADTLSIQYDSSAVQIRTFDNAEIEAFKADSGFNYGRGNAEALGLWERFWYWIRRILNDLWQGENSGDIMRFLLYGFCFFVAIYVILRMLDVDITKLFYKSHDRGLSMHSGMYDNIHELNFEEEIKKALAEKDFRKAIRLRYLSALKKLSDEQVIHWRPGKTNLDYMSEVNVPQLKPDFNQLSYYFSYTWYGNFPADELLYQKTEKVFQQLKQALTAKV